MLRGVWSNVIRQHRCGTAGGVCGGGESTSAGSRHFRHQEKFTTQTFGVGTPHFPRSCKEGQSSAHPGVTRTAWTEAPAVLLSRILSVPDLQSAWVDLVFVCFDESKSLVAYLPLRNPTRRGHHTLRWDGAPHPRYPDVNPRRRQEATCQVVLSAEVGVRWSDESAMLSANWSTQGRRGGERGVKMMTPPPKTSFGAPSIFLLTPNRVTNLGGGVNARLSVDPSTHPPPVRFFLPARWPQSVLTIIMFVSERSVKEIPEYVRNMLLKTENCEIISAVSQLLHVKMRTLVARCPGCEFHVRTFWSATAHHWPSIQFVLVASLDWLLELVHFFGTRRDITSRCADFTAERSFRYSARDW